MKPCNIGIQGICCKNCAMGPCRLPLPKGGIEGEDTRKGPVRRHRQHHCRP
jgi:carbon-monoxide dehydrogenase catalytic subunit